MCSSVDVALIGLEEGLKSHPPNDQKQAKIKSQLLLFSLRLPSKRRSKLKTFIKILEESRTNFLLNGTWFCIDKQQEMKRQMLYHFFSILIEIALLRLKKNNYIDLYTLKKPLTISHIQFQ